MAVDKLTTNTPPANGRSAAFFSAGLDSWCTLLRHLEEKPDLISIWGADIPWDNEAGWKVLYDVLQKSARQFDLPLVTVRSTFRRVITEGELTRAFQPVLDDNWWHGVQYGLAIISHAAPCDWLRGVSRQYIAAAHSKESRDVHVASHPSIDNFVRFCGVQVYHDAYWTRLEKTKLIVDHCKRTGTKIDLHVCWRTVDGKNCCRCEKCYRTMMGLCMEGADPRDYAFAADRTVWKEMGEYMRTDFDYTKDAFIISFWKQLQARERENRAAIQASPNYKYIAWLRSYDFDHPERYWKRRVKRAARNGRDLCRRAARKLRRVLR